MNSSKNCRPISTIALLLFLAAEICATAIAQTQPSDYPPELLNRTLNTRQTYLQWVNDDMEWAVAGDTSSKSTVDKYIDRYKNSGIYAVVGNMPLVVKLAEATANSRPGVVSPEMTKYGNAIKIALASFKDGLVRKVETDNLQPWHQRFYLEPAYLPLYRSTLIAAGQLNEPTDTWFRDIYLYYVRTLHVWGDANDGEIAKATFWRGTTHRVQGEGVAFGLAARWYSNSITASENAKWSAHSRRVFDDYWRPQQVTGWGVTNTGVVTTNQTDGIKGIIQHDTGYSILAQLPQIVAVDQLWQLWGLANPNRYFGYGDSAAGLDKLHSLNEITADGAVPCYNSNGGWNASAGFRVLLFERVADYNRDGRFKYGATLLTNYMRYQRPRMRDQSSNKGVYLERVTACMSAAYLLSKDPLPNYWRQATAEAMPASSLMSRKQAIRVGGGGLARGTNPVINSLFVGNATTQPYNQPNKGYLDNSMASLNVSVPSILSLRSGWGAGDMCALIDLYVGADPLNPGGILSLTKSGAAFTQMEAGKSEPKVNNPQNRIMLEDLSGFDNQYFLDTPNKTIGEDWGDEPGLSTSATVSVPINNESDFACFSVVNTNNFQSYKIDVRREFAFIKNRFLMVRDTVTFRESFPLRLGPIWNTRNSTVRGPNVATASLSTSPSISDGPYDSNSSSLKMPPYDLLVIFAPKADRILTVDERKITLSDGSVQPSPIPIRLGYRWTGTPVLNSKQVFTQIYYPYSRTSTANAENPTWLASHLTITSDTPDFTALVTNTNAARGVEQVIFNPTSLLRTVTSAWGSNYTIETNCRYVYLSKIPSSGAIKKSYLGPASGQAVLKVNGASVLP